MAVYAFFSKITTHWWHVRYVSYRQHNQETLLLHWNYTNSSGYWFMAQNIESIVFLTFLTVISQHWSLLKGNYDFWLPLNISDQIHRKLCPSLFHFARKCTKSSKLRHRTAVPLNNCTLCLILSLLKQT